MADQQDRLLRRFELSFGDLRIVLGQQPGDWAQAAWRLQIAGQNLRGLLRAQNAGVTKLRDSYASAKRQLRHLGNLGASARRQRPLRIDVRRNRLAMSNQIAAQNFPNLRD